MLKLYKFYWGCGRMGSVTGVFVSSDQILSENFGKEVSFGEILGKHSDIRGTLEKKDITEISDNQDVVDIFRKELNGCVGYNPLQFITCPHGVYTLDEVCEVCEEIV